MRHHQVVIIGGGPAGAACAKHLIQSGIDCLILDKQEFPRSKTCAGWITPHVFQVLEIPPFEYPYPLTTFSYLKLSIKGIPLFRIGRQYAIRRVEFDSWLLNISGAPVIQHEVKEILETDSGYQIDQKFSADFLIGAGGTHCPVYHSFFKSSQPRTGEKIVALEEEYPAEWHNGICQLWFFENNLPGYAWYVPKAAGYLNIGLGGNERALKEKGLMIGDLWDLFLAKLKQKGLVHDREFKPDGYVYYLRSGQESYRIGNVFLIGDAAGLATLDMGEGIGPAIQSGILAANAIITRSDYSLAGIDRYSLLPKYLQWAVSR
jgi:flavin-dependent dehydrogenase